MRGPIRRSLRFRLATAGFFAIYLPVLILILVSASTSVEVGSTDDVDVTIGADGRVDSVEARDITVENRTANSPWIILTGFALAPVAALASWWWAGRAVQPIDRIRGVADEIQAGDLSQRIGLDEAPSEVAALGASFDSMLDRLERSARLQRELLDETSHEVRTPLTILTTNADVMLAHPDPTKDDYRRAIERSKTTAEHLSHIVTGLLADARGRARTVERQAVDLSTTLAHIVEDAHALASASDVQLTYSGPTEFFCAVDESSVVRAVTNLIDNAIRHSPAHGTVAVLLDLREAEAVVSVVDDGPGVAPEDQEMIFERLWHGSKPDVGQTERQAAPDLRRGLGLTIARQIAESHGGSLEVISPTSGDRGARFELRLPMPA